MIDVGDRIWWETVRGPCSGIVTEIWPNDNYLVRLDNGKAMIVHELSISNWERPLQNK